MKKLMVVAAIAFAATFANAAAVGWGCAGLGNYDGDAYQFFVIGQNGVTSVAQITALVESGSSVATYAFGNGEVKGNGISVSTDASGKTITGAGTYESFFVLFDDDTIADATKYIAITKEQSANLEKTITAQAATLSFSGQNQTAYVNDSTNWTSINVPEPTSGLLLLLGMAGLALKRKLA